MAKFPVHADKGDVLRALTLLGFRVVREAEHLAMLREELDGTRTPLTLPNHRRIKGSTLRTICRQSRISRDDFISAFHGNAPQGGE